jgi:16S rRNA (cytosine967-C5)-methyltransferase
MRLDRLLSRSNLTQQDRALARELALGACRRKATIDAVARSFMQCPDRPLPGALKEILAVAIYQMLFLDRVPNHAAVNEAVEQAIRHRHKRKSGMVNGVLRTIGRRVSSVVEGVPPLDSDVIPIGPGVYRKTDRAVFPDPQSNPAAYLSAAYSLPLELAERWIERFGSVQAAADVAAYANFRAPLIMRVNRLKADIQSVLDSLTADGMNAVAHDNGQSVVMMEYRAFSDLKAFTDGLIQPQDPSATEVVLAADPKPGMKVLDFCASPGTKTTHLAERMHDSGSVLAVDTTPDKLRRVEDNCQRLGVTIVKALLADKVGTQESNSFDMVLADVPCTNTGVLARRAEARWRFGLGRLQQIAKTQRELLTAASIFVKPGGSLVYSTCSIESEECGDIVRWFVGRHPDFKLLAEKMTLPGGQSDPCRWHDGGYYAVLEK